MKNNAIRVKGRYYPKLFNTIILVKLTIILTLLFHLTAIGNSLAQNERATIHLTSVKLSTVLKEIESQTKYRFVYGDDLVEGLGAAFAVHAQNQPVKDILDELLTNTDLSFRMHREYLIILSKEEKQALATQSNIRGLVKDNQGRPLPGVTVNVLGENNNTVLTDQNGIFRIRASAGQVLRISYVGHISQNIKLTTAHSIEGIKVQLETGVNTLEETVVVGYGSVKRKDLTGSVVSVDVKEIRDVPFTSIDQALTGKAAGVQVIQADGSPGGVAKIRIRGGTSLMGGNDPLYIIDGVQMTVQNRYVSSSAEVVNPVDRFGSDDPNSAVSGSFARGLNSLAGLNISDIETIDVLKDASATAIYGSRAANGVVIITTKRGKREQKPTLEANYYHGISKQRPINLLNRDQYIMIMQEANRNLLDARKAAGETLTPEELVEFDNRINNPNFYGPANTDWLNMVTRTGKSDNADLSVRGGGNASQYFISLGYTGNQGVVLGTDFQRLSGRINLDNEITSKLRTQATFGYGYTINNITNGLYTQALFAPPTFAAYNADGSIAKYTGESIGGYDYQGYQNPLVLLDGINRAASHALLGSVAADYKILPELIFRSTASVNYNSTNQRNYVTGDALIAASNGVGTSSLGTGSQSQNQLTDLFFENTLTWDKVFNAQHRFNIVGGTSWQKTRSQLFGVTAQGYPDDKYLNNLSSASLVTAAVGTSGQNSLLSFYTRARYAWKDRYIVTFTGRSDASSKFPKVNRTGFFPSGGVAWRISEEPFMKGIKWVDDLKLRASTGYTGTQNIGDNMFYTLYSPFSYGGKSAMVPTQLGNEAIRWESTLQKDAGLDISLFDSRFGASIEVYEKATSGILFTKAVAGSSSYGSVIANLANIRNRGLEIALRGTFLQTKDLSWNGAFNISFNRSRVTNVNRDFTNPNDITDYNLGNAIVREGEPLGLIYGKVFTGLLQTQEQVDAYKEKNKYWMYFDPYLGIGDPSYKIPEGEFFPANEIIGHAEPKFYGGYTNSITYKGLSLTTLFTFSYGNDILYQGDIQNNNVSNRSNKTTEILGRWTPENPTSTRPRLIYEQNGTAYTNSAAVYDGSFLRLKSLTLTYVLPEAWRKRIGLPQASVFGSATNILTWTSYPGVDPEVSNDPYSLINGASDPGTFPAVKQFILGLRFSL
ncbi:TonB-dependent receptor [Sphingobacterium sp.]|uniref:TonB-dependent receptor n=1 Tax=Sphingobacterium sp. TaxID=341027 RepID=UPI0031D8E88F